MQTRRQPADTQVEHASKDEGTDEAERSYYYDDAHGYEDFDPEDEDEEGSCDD